jgi:hypothetical protein
MFVHGGPLVYRHHAFWELLSNLVFEWRWSCCDLAGFGFNSVFEFDTGDDFGEVVKAV